MFTLPDVNPLFTPNCVLSMRKKGIKERAALKDSLLVTLGPNVSFLFSLHPSVPTKINVATFLIDTLIDTIFL